MNSAGLFVDYETTCSALADSSSGGLRHDILASKLVNGARTCGDLVYTIAWADWDRLPGAQRVVATSGYDARFVAAIPGEKDSLYSAMRAEIKRILATESSPDVFVIGTDGDCFVSLAKEIQGQGKEVVFIVAAGKESKAAREVADGVVELTYSEVPTESKKVEEGTPSQGFPPAGDGGGTRQQTRN